MLYARDMIDSGEREMGTHVEDTHRGDGMLCGEGRVRVERYASM